jgi:hypothetical protein
LDLTDKSEEDIKTLLDEYHNFKFAGFSVRGKVDSLNSKEGGPAGV